MSRTGSFQSLTTRNPLYATLLWGEQCKSIRVLIDSGVDESFMDTTLVSELGISTQPLSILMDVRALDGRSIGRITHNTVPIKLRVSGNHSESMQFLLLEFPHVPIVLEFIAPVAQPLIDWAKGSIMGWSPFCHAHCLKIVQPAPGCLLAGLGEALDLSAVPAEYQDVREVFNSARATSLGLTNAPAVFQALVNDVLCDMLNQFVTS